MNGIDEKPSWRRSPGWMKLLLIVSLSVTVALDVRVNWMNSVIEPLSAQCRSSRIRIIGCAWASVIRTLVYDSNIACWPEVSFGNVGDGCDSRASWWQCHSALE